MRVTITEARLSDTDPDTGKHYALEQGDSISVPDAIGKAWCDRGWATDVAGEYPTGERIPGPAALEPKAAKVKGMAVHGG